MSTKFLDYTGLAYFWGKLKAYFAKKATTLAGYGITDAKIASGTITLGSNTITPLTSASSLNAAKLTGTASVNTTGNAATADTADKVANKLMLKVKTGTTEGTDQYTYDGSGAKTLDIKQGSNITLTAASGSLTIAGVGDTKNTAGSTDSSSKLFLIGATSQAASPQTYSHDTAYVGTDGCLYSGGTKVLTAHQDISGKADDSSVVHKTGNETIADTKTFSSRIDGTIGKAVGNDSYTDIIQTRQSDNGNRRSCTIRCQNGNGFNEISLCAHDESDNYPVGIAIRNTNGTVTVTSPYTPDNRNNSKQIATTEFVANNAARYITANTTIYVSTTAAGNGSGSSAANAMNLLSLQNYLASARMQPGSSNLNSSYRLTVLFVPTGSSYGDVTFDFNKMPGVRYLTIGTSTGTASTTSNYTTNSPLFGNINVTGSPLSVTINNIQSTGTITAAYGAVVTLGTYAGFARLYAQIYGKIDVGSGTYNIHNAGLSYLCYSTEYGQIILNTATMAFNFREQCYFTAAIFGSDAHGRIYVNYGRSKFTGTKPIVSRTVSGTKTGTSATAAGTAAKVVSLADGQTFTLANNAVAYVTFDNTNTAANPTLNINGTGAKPIYFNGAVIPAGYINKHIQYKFTYNGTQFVCNNTFQRVEQMQSMSMFNYGSYYNTTYNSGEWNWDGFERYWGNGCWVNNVFQGSLNGNAATATEFSANKSVTLTGDVTGSASSKAGWSIATTVGAITNAQIAAMFENDSIDPDDPPMAYPERAVLCGDGAWRYFEQIAFPN